MNSKIAKGFLWIGIVIWGVLGVTFAFSLHVEWVRSLTLIKGAFLAANLLGLIIVLSVSGYRKLKGVAVTDEVRVFTFLCAVIFVQFALMSALTIR